jgi:hypothetical protein
METPWMRVTLLQTAYSRAERAPTAREAALVLDLADQVLDRFRPEVLLTYGGQAMANGIPVLASDRGALPETLGDAGFVFTIPERCTPTSGLVPTAQEVAPWVAVIERLWDDPEIEAEHRRRALAEAMRWDGERLAKRFEDFFHPDAIERSELS